MFSIVALSLINLILLDQQIFVVEWKVQQFWRPQQDLEQTTLLPWLKDYYLRTRVLPWGLLSPPSLCNGELHSRLSTDSY